MTDVVKTLCSPRCAEMARSTASSVLRRCSRGFFPFASLFEGAFKVSQRRPELGPTASTMPLEAGAPPALGSSKPKWLQITYNADTNECVNPCKRQNPRTNMLCPKTKPAGPIIGPKIIYLLF